MRLRPSLLLLATTLGCGTPSEAPKDQVAPDEDRWTALSPEKGAFSFTGVEVDFGETSARKWMGQGWSHDEAPRAGALTFVWSVGPRSEVVVDLGPGPQTLRGRVRTWKPGDDTAPVQVFVDGERVGEFVPRPGWSDVELPLPAFDAPAQHVIAFETDAVRDEPSSADKRPLAIAWDWLRIDENGASATRAQRIDLGVQATRATLGEGWSHDETTPDGRTFVWAVGSRAHVTLDNSSAGASTLSLRVLQAPLSPGNPQSVELLVNGTSVGRETMRTDDEGTAVPWQLLTWELAEGALRAGANELELRFDRVRVPPSGPNVDGRALALAVDNIRLAHRPQTRAVQPDTLFSIPARIHPDTRVKNGSSFPISLSVVEPATGVATHASLAAGETATLVPPSGAKGLFELQVRTDSGSIDPKDIRIEADAVDIGPRRPHILVVLVDTLRADRTSLYGYSRDTTPELTEFAASATTYLRAQSQSSWTRPACASLQTGLHPREHGATGRLDRLAANHRTLATILRSAGYSTSAFITNGTVGAEFGFERGFDTFYRFKERRDERVHHPAGEVLDAALDRFEHTKETGRPAFQYVHLTDPHGPYQPPEPFRSQFAPGVAAEIGTTEWIRSAQRDGAPFDADAWEQASDLYDAEIAYTDHSFGRWIDALSERGLLDNSLIVFLSDHGEEFLDHGHIEHGRSLHQEQLGVPLVVHFPKGSGPTPGTSDFPAQTIDILPTALRAAGVPSALYQGVALQDTPSDHARVTRAHLDLEGHRFESARSYPQKVIRDLSSDGEVKAYDLATDPAEQAPLDLAPEHTRLLELLDAHKESIGEVEGQPTEISDELRQSLKAMGYLGDE